MTDRELLENAAKAAGIESAKWDDKTGAMYWPYRSPLTNCHLWSPLTDDGDALRLAVMLNEFEPYKSRGGIRLSPGLTVEKQRRAIVRAAAEIGKVME